MVSRPGGLTCGGPCWACLTVYSVLLDMPPVAGNSMLRVCRTLRSRPGVATGNRKGAGCGAAGLPRRGQDLGAAQSREALRRRGQGWGAVQPRKVVPPPLLGLLRRLGLAGVALVAVLGWAAAAPAHQLYVFAYAEGQTIHGEAYFRGHIPAQHLPVRIFGPAGEELGRTETDNQGRFTFEAHEQCDHRFVVASADGHQAEYLLPAAELAGAGPPAAERPASKPPQGLLAEQHLEQPPPSGQGPGSASASGQATAAHRPAGAIEQSSQPRSLPAEADKLAARIEALQSQVAALRQELAQFEQTIRLRDVLGGIGYIVGLAGVACYFLGLKRKPQGAGRQNH